MLQLLGSGSFGEVYLVRKKGASGQLYAMKVLCKKMVQEKNLLRYVMTERDILAKTNHTFIMKLNFAFQTKSKLFLVLDYCPGGDLKKQLKQ